MPPRPVIVPPLTRPRPPSPLVGELNRRLAAIRDTQGTLQPAAPSVSASTEAAVPISVDAPHSAPHVGAGAAPDPNDPDDERWWTPVGGSSILPHTLSLFAK